MKNNVFTLLVLIVSSLQANDGAYYASGNHLIPIDETEVCINKEILSLVRKVELSEDGEYEEDYIYVTVDYTFFNPTNDDRKILVGFEAPSPSGDVSGYPINGKHPYISNFSVLMNGVSLNYETAIVNEETYYINNKIDAKTEEEVMGADFNSNEPEFYYVYHFTANFKPGKNKIIHKYKFALSGSVMDKYKFDYILTAANRWANHQIDDFTLNIEVGESESFYLWNTFFDENDKWDIPNGRQINTESIYNKEPISQFITYSGKISLKKENFKPKGELALYSPQEYIRERYEEFNYKENDLPSKIIISELNKDFDDDNDILFTKTKSTDKVSFKILRNLPFAIRGYVFKTKIIQDYYLTQKWYKPNPNYVSDLESLFEDEKKWLKEVKLNE